MKFTESYLEGVYEVVSEPFVDNRGFFERVFCVEEFKDKNLCSDFVQINHSFNKKTGTLRGVHLQKPPHAETKLVRCISGKVFDFVVDLRSGSKTFLKWYGTVLSEEKSNSLYIPQGFAHGFLTLENNSHLVYFHSHRFVPESEIMLNYKDPKINIILPESVSVISNKDANAEFLSNNFKGF